MRVIGRKSKSNGKVTKKKKKLVLSVGRCGVAAKARTFVLQYYELNGLQQHFICCVMFSKNKN